MKHLVLFVLFILAVPALMLAQYSEPIETFDAEPDSALFSYEMSTNVDTLKGFVNVSLATDEVALGAGAARLEYSAHDIESWGGYSKVYHMLPDSQVYDWSAWDSISFWYYNEIPQSLVGRVNLRFELYEVSDVPDTTSGAGSMEFYYSFHYVLDNPVGWNEIKMPLKDGRGDPTLDEWNGEAFNRTGWAGVTGNDQLDKNKIKGWAFEFSISGSGSGDVSAGTIIIDHLSLKGYAGKSLVIFNGMNENPALGKFTWGQSVLEVVEGEGYVEGSNALKWTQGDEWGNGWSGAGYNLPAIDLSREWLVDSLRFKMKADPGTPALRMQFEDGAAKVGHTFNVAADDGAWHVYALALKDFDYVDGTTGLDTAAISVFQMMGEGNASAGRVILFDELWTGDPVIDVIPPAAPIGVAAVPNGTDKYNLVIWQDVPGEGLETYSVYASEEPITDLTAPGVEMIASGVEEGKQATRHDLRYPMAEKQVTYFYAVTCKDKAGNVSVAGVSSTGVTNTAAAAPTISLELPANLVIDGDISEWLSSSILPFRFNKTLGTHVAVGDPSTAFESDADMDITGYLAMDDNFLYLAFDVVDDIYSFDPAGNFWEDDVFELYIGLYNLTEKHKSYKRGAEPDYKCVALADTFFLDVGGLTAMFPLDSPDYEFVNYGASDWSVEAKISLDDLITIGSATGDTRFHPERGMKIPLDLVFHDSDAANVRAGSYSFSPLNMDNSHASPSNWFYTWIGDTNKVATALDDDINLTVADFALSQNYPNPFNPSTTIEYSLAKAVQVNITVYNTVGQKVATLVNAKMNAGVHLAKFNAQDFSSGVYFYQIKAGDFVQTKKMLLVK